MHCGSLETARKCMVWLWGIQEAWCSDLLGTHCTSPFHLPSATEFMLLETRKIGDSTKKNFRVQLMGSLACWWNCCAANIFSRAYVKKNGNWFKHEALTACFNTHIQTLWNLHNRIKAGPTKTQVDIKHYSTSARQMCRQGVCKLQI